jgi:hypothetical protein
MARLATFRSELILLVLHKLAAVLVPEIVNRAHVCVMVYLTILCHL